MRFGKPRKNTRRNNPRYFTVTENLKVENNSNKNMHDVQFYLEEFYPFAKKALGFDQDATVVFESDLKNSKNPLGKTAHYNPAVNTVTVYVDNRHPKDVMRSVSHELVHHAQNLRGDLGGGAMEEGYAQNDDHLRKMEEEAYRKGNMVFRDWTDTRNNPDSQDSVMSRLMQEWGYDDKAITENSEKFEEGQLVVVVASALAVDGEKTGTVVKSDGNAVTIKLDDDQEGKHVPEDKMVKVKTDYVEARAEAGFDDAMGETKEVNEMYDDDYDDFDMGALEDEFPWLAKSVKTKEVPAELAAELAAEFGDKEEPEDLDEPEEALSEEDYDSKRDAELEKYGSSRKYGRRSRRTKDAFGNRIKYKPKTAPAEKEEEEEVVVMKEKGFHGSDEEKEMTAKMSNKEFSDYHTRDKHLSPDLKGDMGPLPGMEGPFQFKSGAVLYYDNKTGEYYDRGQDMYLDRDEAAELTMEEGMGGKVDHKKAAWMKAYNDAAGNPQPPPQDFWDTATFLYNQGDDPVEAGQHYAARAGKGVEPDDDDQGVYSMNYTEGINEGQKTWAEYGADDAQKGRPASPPRRGLSPDKREWHEYMEAYKAAAGQTVGGSTGAHMNEMEGDGENWGAIMDKAQSVLGYEPELEQTGDGYVLNLDGPLDEVDEDGLMMVFPNGRKLDDTTFSTGVSSHMNEMEGDGEGWGEIHGNASEEAPTMDAAVNALSKLDKTIESYLQNVGKFPQYEADARDLQEIRGMFWQEIKNGATPGNFSQELKNVVASLDTIVRDEVPQELYYSLHPEILENKKMELEEMVRQAIRTALKEKKYRREDEKEEVDEMKYRREDAPSDSEDEEKEEMDEMKYRREDDKSQEAEEEEEESVDEALSAAQKELDVDGDGDIEGDDLADLRTGKNADDDEEKVDELTNKEWYDSNLFESLMKKWAN